MGWFSIGIGVAELLATKPLARVQHMEDQKKLLRGVGIREIGAGIGILSQPRRGPWLWARVAGDALDLAVLGRSAVRSTVKIGPMVAAAAVAGITVVDVLCGRQLSARST